MSRRTPIIYRNKPQRKKLQGYSPLVKKQQNIHNTKNINGQLLLEMKQKKSDDKGMRIQLPINSKQKNQINTIGNKISAINQQNIKNCILYKMLQEDIKELGREYDGEIQRIKKIRQQRRRQRQLINKQQFGIKLSIWELTNQVNQIKQLIQEQQSQTDRFLQQIRPSRLAHFRGSAGGNLPTNEQLELTIDRQEEREIP